MPAGDIAGTQILDSASYWIGLANTTGGWRWADGTAPNNFVSDEEPYGHWAPEFYIGWKNNECFYARSALAYLRC